jgi:hypothetical protein
MMSNQIEPSGRETFFPASELIVSKTDLKGRMTARRCPAKSGAPGRRELIASLRLN